MWNVLIKILGTKSVLEPRPALPPDDARQVGERLKSTIHALYGGRALRVRHVDAGSNNGEEFELTALGNAYYDIEQYGISFVASPRHADVLTVSGPVTRNMEHALKTAYDMTPEPKIVVAVGDGAATGGIWKGSYAVVGGVSDVIPVDVVIPGDPPSPTAMLTGLLAAVTRGRH
jgi:Ni,Fe-hydrogenase III small subunit